MDEIFFTVEPFGHSLRMMSSMIIEDHDGAPGILDISVDLLQELEELVFVRTPGELPGHFLRGRTQSSHDGQGFSSFGSPINGNWLSLRLPNASSLIPKMSRCLVNVNDIEVSGDVFCRLPSPFRLFLLEI